MPFKIPSPNELPRPVRLAVQAVKDYVDGLSKPSDWTAPTLLNSWVNFDATNWATAQYRKIGDTVEIRGLVKSGTAGTVFTLPSGFRPPLRRIFSQDSNTGYARVDVYPNGDVLWVSGGTGWLTLNCRFSTV